MCFLGYTHLFVKCMTLEVVCEEVLGRADDNFSNTDDMDILQLRHFGKHLGDLAEVAHVDPTVVDCVRQCLAVHGRSTVVEAVPDECWDLDSDQEVGSILDQLTFLLELALVFGMDDSRGEHIRVEPASRMSNSEICPNLYQPDVKFSLLKTSNSLCRLLHNLLCAVLHLRLLFR